MIPILWPGQLISNDWTSRRLYDSIVVRGERVYHLAGEGGATSSGPWLVITSILVPSNLPAFYSFVLSATDLGWYFVYEHMADKLLPRDETPIDMVYSPRGHP